MYLTPTENHWACDIEADNLLDEATTIWCCTVENVITGEKHAFTAAAAFRDWLSSLDSDYYLVGHNFVAYDLVMLNRHWGCRIPVKRVVDTYVLSQLYNPSFPGGHSLSVWGERLRYPKTEFSDFSRYTPEMRTYCANDTSLTALLYRKLTARMRALGFTEQGAEIEHLSWNIIQNKQRRHGFPFNYEKAHKLYVQIRAREEELRKEIYELWPPKLERVGKYSKPFKQNGERSANYSRHLSQFPEVRLTADGYETYDYVEFNLGSPSQRIEKLLELGWEPTKFTAKTASGGGGNPQVDEESLLDFAEVSGKREVAALAKWIVANSRANMIRTWMDAYNEKTGAIHGRLFIASTLRYRHSNPNSANIPAVRTKKVDGHDMPIYGEEGAWTYESRDLFYAGESGDFSLVGIDAKGIQLRVLANYAHSEGFVSSVLAGDPHTRNIEVLGLANKPAAKKFLYTTLMGGGGAKLAMDQGQFGTKLTERDGTRLKNLLIDSIPGFRQLIKRLQDELSRTGRITLCDGTPILVPSPHMVIPYLLQGDESRIMKLTSVYIDEEIRRRRWTNDVFKVADIHDEYQFKVRKSVVDDFITMALAQFIRAGETFRYKIKIEGDAKVGETWACTH